MLLRNTAIGEIQRRAGERAASTAFNDEAMQRDAVLRSGAMQRQHGASIGDGAGDNSADAPVDADSDEERFRLYRTSHDALMRAALLPHWGVRSRALVPLRERRHRERQRLL